MTATTETARPILEVRGLKKHFGGRRRLFGPPARPIKAVDGIDFAIRPGETTAPLFTCVTFDAGMGNEYQNATATVHVAAEAVQTANNGVTALEALGWPTQG